LGDAAREALQRLADAASASPPAASPPPPAQPTRDDLAPLIADLLEAAKGAAKAGMFDEAPGQRSVRRVAFFLSFLLGVGVCIAGLFVEVSDPVKDLVVAILASATGAVGLGRFAEAWEARGKGEGGGE
jgi:hypothetical protein